MRKVNLQDVYEDVDRLMSNPTKAEKQAEQAEDDAVDILVKEVYDARLYLVSVRKYILRNKPSLEIYTSLLSYEQRLELLFELIQTQYLPDYDAVTSTLIKQLQLLGYFVPLMQKALSMPSMADAINLIRRFFKNEAVIKPDFVWSKREQDFVPTIVERKGKVRPVAIEARYLKGDRPYITEEGKIGLQERPYYETEEDLFTLLDTLKGWAEGLKPIPKENTWDKAGGIKKRKEELAEQKKREELTKKERQQLVKARKRIEKKSRKKKASKEAERRLIERMVQEETQKEARKLAKIRKSARGRR